MGCEDTFYSRHAVLTEPQPPGRGLHRRLMAAEGETLAVLCSGRVVFSGSIVFLTAVNKPQWSGFAVPELVAVAGLA